MAALSVNGLKKKHVRSSTPHSFHRFGRCFDFDFRLSNYLFLLFHVIVVNHIGIFLLLLLSNDTRLRIRYDFDLFKLLNGRIMVVNPLMLKSSS